MINYVMLIFCMGGVFYMGFVALKPALLHDPEDYNKAFFVRVYEFPEFLTHKYHLGNVIAGLGAIGIIAGLMYVGNMAYKEILTERERLAL